jgi:hypothetical protein
MTLTDDDLRARLGRLADHARTTPRRPLHLGPAPEPAPRLQRPARPRLVALLAAAATVAVLAGVGVVLTSGDGGDARVGRTTTEPDVTGTTSAAADPAPPKDALAGLLREGAAHTMAPAPIAARSGAAAVWSGDELLVWGGYRFDGVERPLGDGAAYDPATDTWRILPDAPIEARAYPAAVWTGEELLIWGGSDAGRLLGDGAAYRPSTDTWRQLPDAPIRPAMKSGVVWTGEDLLVAGGLNGGGDTAAYRPNGDTWERRATAPGTQTPPYPRAIWGGGRAWFLLVSPYAGPIDVELGSYDPATNRWDVAPTPLAGIPNLLWTGREVLGVSALTAAAYDPATGAWRTLPTPNDGNAIEAVWTGTTAVLFDGATSAASLDPTTGRWVRTVFDVPAVTRLEPVVVWADGVLLVWGGPAFGGGPSEGTTGADPGGFVARPLQADTAPAAAEVAASVKDPLDQGPPTTVPAAPDGVPVTTVPGTPVAEDGRVQVALGPDGGIGWMLASRPPATVRGQRNLNFTEVYDDADVLIGYFSCRFVPLTVVEDPGVDLNDLCAGLTGTTVGG